MATSRRRQTPRTNGTCALGALCCTALALLPLLASPARDSILAEGQRIAELHAPSQQKAPGATQLLAPGLQRSYRLIPWDMRGHGESVSPDDQALYNHQHTVNDMCAILDHLHLEQAVIAGHSLGGFMSLAFHVAYPQRVKALILQGCGPGYRNAEARATWNARAEQRARTLETHGLSALGGGSEVRISTQHSALGLAKAARGILAQVDARVIDSLPHIRVPTLIIVGAGIHRSSMAHITWRRVFHMPLRWWSSRRRMG